MLVLSENEKLKQQLGEVTRQKDEADKNVRYLQKAAKKSSFDTDASGSSKAASELAHAVNIAASVPKRKNPIARNKTNNKKTKKSSTKNGGKENEVPEPSNKEGHPVSFWSFGLMDVHRAVWT